jgi:single-strand DNA-binding protein
MANLNKVILIGRLTRDVETRSFPSGGMVSKFGFAVTNRKKNSQTGQWEDEPMYIDVEVYNRGEFGKLADLVRDRCRKGSQLMIEGKLHLDQWEDKNGGGKRSKHKLVVDNVQLLDPRPDGAPGSYGGKSGGSRSSVPPDDGGGDDYGGDSGGSSGSGGGDEQIPF